MVSKPSFDPNDLGAALEAAYSGSDEETPLINRAIDGLYPPGSVFKTVTLSSALENIPGVANRTFNDQGKITFDDGTTLNNYAYQSHGAIDLRYAYRVSSNVVFGTLAMELGNSTLKQTAENYGFNSVISGPGLTITASQFPTLESYAQGEIAQSGIGQGGVLSTPIQMALVAATVANDGVMMQPRLVNSILDSAGNTVKTMEDTELKQVVSSDIASTIPGPWGAAASAALGIGAGVTDRLFGSKMNTENIAKVEANINALNNFKSDASNFDQLAQNWSNAVGGMEFSDSFIGSDGIFSNKAKKKARSLREQVAAGKLWADNSLNNNAENISDTQMGTLMENYLSLGGNLLSKGGSIFIKPENRGKFTETKRRTGKTTEELTHSKNPITRKRAIFALNSRHWNKHSNGGYLEGREYDLDELEIKRLIDAGYEIEYL